MNPIKVAVVGAGTMGTVHAEAYKNMPDVQLVGIVDINRDTAQYLAFRQRTDDYTSLDALIREKRPDVVDVCVPTYLHRQVVETAARAGCHVICEKPIARTLADARAMIETCRAAGVQLYIAHVVRFFPEYRRAYELLQSGAIGRVGTVRAMRGGAFPKAWQDWYANVARCGTVIVDSMIHDFDFLRWCFGEVERVYAKSLLGRDLLQLDHAFVSLRFQNGVIAHVEGTWAYPSGFRTELEIAGSEGMIDFRSDQAAALHSQFQESDFVRAGVEVPESPLVKNPYQLELEHFLACIRDGEQPLVTAEDGLKALEISLAALTSVETREPVVLHPADAFGTDRE
ncbi:MAG: Gfo/Idh/MocA family oxidoreductase [Alicyclobacillus herbarius]|uniref:Gfo/Idh/MocA family protein n=1 Tax=Alicyclobacillus herbarius TaxID=122960 RepID=UPI002355F7CE|nr:Gfo/Idh/MocA family oxidoreductase [Alicyclobacillus herbarius]MCL6632162.1 Gfo/Idh/MocA family oxidoreductase [Alicyclobacillus herbarius]